MEPTGGSVLEFVAGVAPARRREDAEVLLGLFSEVSGHEAAMWGGIIGFGSCHYRYPTGTEGDMPLLAFAPRKAAMTVYVDSAQKHTAQLDRLGPHTSSVSCIYIKDLSKVDLDVLREILVDSLAWTLAGGDENAVITVAE
ncbi:DUF1801 domain-containing protein [Microbacterium sp. RU33B]|uniref:DUF1801 domain-containing protein n=1 Tax=Microbacterium sp. RU33B TaxID=1907390 RepID=UPI000966A283|nr:DUF1801 domain-containing protein [Microbacterium sp. RU33B]SIT86509.1 protein of unknown function (DU1801) [Microbacterium sp. RU33B]